MNHRVGRLIFGFAVGLLVAVMAYRWAIDPAPRAERALEESVVASARRILVETLDTGDLEIIDPLNTNRKIGKTYIYRSDDGWEISGFYRRSADDRWHAYLLSLSGTTQLEHLKFQDNDEALIRRAANNPQLEAVP